MSTEDCDTIAQAPVQTTLAAIFFSMELSRSTWLITSLSPGDGEKMSKRTLPAGDLAGLLSLLDRLRKKSRCAYRRKLSLCGDPGSRPRRLMDPSRARAGRKLIATSSIRHRWRPRGDVDARRPTDSTARPCCGRSSPICALRRPTLAIHSRKGV